MMATDIDLSNLTASEYESILTVLKRDHELRSAEEARIRPLKQELAYLRRRAALRQGVNPDRSCARCLAELGWILNRGATCQICLKRVCKACRCYATDENQSPSAWLCVLCYKQTLLKATSGDWMLEFRRLPVHQRKVASTVVHLEKVLSETPTEDQMDGTESIPKQPPSHSRSPCWERHSPKLPAPQVSRPVEDSCPSSEVQSSREIITTDVAPLKAKAFSQSRDSLSPKMQRKLPHKSCSAYEPPVSRGQDDCVKSKEFASHSLELVPEKSRARSAETYHDFARQVPSPWSGIEAEPTIPMRSIRAASFGHLMSIDCSDTWGHREWLSSDSTASAHSHSSINEEAEDLMLAPMKPPRKKVSPLCKQQAVLEAVSLDRQNSSVETTDSGVFSPEVKSSEEAYEKSSLSSPYALRNKDSLDSCLAVYSHASRFYSGYSSSSSEGDDSFQDPNDPASLRRKTLMQCKKEGVLDSSDVHLKADKDDFIDESGNSLRSSPHGRMRIRHRTLSGGSEDGRTKKDSVPHISISECVQSLPEGTTSSGSLENDSFGLRDDDMDQVFSYHSRSQMSLSSFGGRSESVTSVYSAAGGGRYGTVTVTGEVLFSLCYNYKASVFEVLIKECRNLAPVDTKRNRSDPYVKIYLLPDRTKSGKRKTKVKKHTLNPVFDEPLKFQVTISEVERRTLWLSVWHSDRFGRNDFLGEVTLPLAHDSFESPELKWYPLQERMETLDSPVSYKGDLILALKYVPFDVASHKPRKKANNQSKGSLHVLVKEARNLMATRSNGTSDPFCKSYLLPDKSKSGKQKTPVLRKTCSPKWNHTFVYEEVTVDDLKEKCLELTIWDYDKITSNDFLGGVRLCLGTGKHIGREVDWMDSIGEEISLWHTMLDRPNMWIDGSLLLRPSMQNRRIA